MFVVVCLILGVGISQGSERLDPLVQTSQGLIRGQKADDGNYYIFLGIPYAVVDENNPFGTSTAHPKFDDIYEAYDDSAICPQIEDYTNSIIGTLGCLRLNIYVPWKANSRNRLPVLVWIHGGAFNVGNGGRRLYGPKYLLKNDVILVTINYRLGPYGFLCPGIPEVPGNQGLKDQLIALKWIKENIGNFGGDDNKITLMGKSAGSSSVELHIFSKQQNLFHKAILQSGTVLRPAGIRETDAEPALQIAEKLGYATENVSEAIAFLVKVDFHLVMGAYSELSINLRPCIEKEIENIDSFITEHPINLDIPKVKSMPILAGFNDREALMTDANKRRDYFKSPSYFEDTLKLTFNFDENFKQSVNTVRHFYIGDEDLTEEVRPDIIDFESDFYYNYPIQWSLNKFVENGATNVFQYLFSYDGGLNNIKNYYNITLKGVAHADELGYLFDMHFDEITPSDEDELVIERITKLWTNFVKYGDPTPEVTEQFPEKWRPIDTDAINYLDIGSQLSVAKRPFSQRLAFWKLFFMANKEKLKNYTKVSVT